MTNLPQFKVKYGEGVGIELFFQFPNLSDNEKSFFDDDEASGQSTLSANGTNFSSGQYIVLGRPGSEHTEIVRISGSPTSTAINVSTTVFAHNRGEPIVFIPYNQITPERSTDSGANYSALSAINIRPDATETYLQRASDASTDYYRFRFSNSADVTYSAYSDGQVATGFGENTVFNVKRSALLDLGESKGNKLTDDFLNMAIFDGRREIGNDANVLRWSFRTKFNTDIGDIIPGRWSVAAPSDLLDPNTNKNILALRLGRNSLPLDYQDRVRFNDNYRNIAHSTLNGAITGASTSIILTSSGDFDESGSVDIAAESISGTIDNAAYTTNTESTATLGTVTSIADSHSSGRDVWQGASFGFPQAYTIDNGVIYFDVPLQNSSAGENIYMDYYQEIQSVDSDADTLNDEETHVLIPWVKWKIKYMLSGGKLKQEEDPDYKEFALRKSNMVKKEISGQRVRLIPS